MNASTTQDVNADLIKLTDTELFVLWEKTSGILATYKAKENELRTEIVRRKFENAPVGTNAIDLAKGYILKCVKKLTYTLDPKLTPEALKAIAALGNEGQFLASRLVKWKPDLSLTEYKQLPPDAKAIIDKVLTIKPAMPTLEIVEPKKK